MRHPFVSRLLVCALIVLCELPGNDAVAADDTATKTFAPTTDSPRQGAADSPEPPVASDLGSWLAQVPEPKHYTLLNGLQVVLQPMVGRGQVTVMVDYHIGSGDDPEGLSGLAHLVEHLTYRGSRHLADTELISLLESNGISQMNGVTGADFTRYFATVPKTRLGLALWLESERMAFTLERFNQAHLDIERNVVKSELLSIRHENRRPLRHAFRWAYGEGHPYAKPPDLTSDLDHIALEHVQAFFQGGYRPDNATLVVVGDFEISSAEKLIDKYFAPIVAGGTKLVPKTIPPPLGVRTLERISVFDFVAEEEAFRLWAGPTPGTRDSEALRHVLIALARMSRQALRKARVNASVTAVLEPSGMHSLVGLRIRLKYPSSTILSPWEANRVVAAQLRELPYQDWGKLLSERKNSTAIAQLQVLEDPRQWAKRIIKTLRRTGKPYQARSDLRIVGGLNSRDLTHAQNTYLQQGPGMLVHIIRAEPGTVVGPNGRVQLVEKDN